MKIVLPVVDYTRDWIQEGKFEIWWVKFTHLQGGVMGNVLHVGYLFYDYVRCMHSKILFLHCENTITCFLSSSRKILHSDFC